MKAFRRAVCSALAYASLGPFVLYLLLKGIADLLDPDEDVKE